MISGQTGAGVALVGLCASAGIGFVNDVNRTLAPQRFLEKAEVALCGDVKHLGDALGNDTFIGQASHLTPYNLNGEPVVQVTDTIVAADSTGRVAAETLYDTNPAVLGRSYIDPRATEPSVYGQSAFTPFCTSDGKLNPSVWLKGGFVDGAKSPADVINSVQKIGYESVNNQTIGEITERMDNLVTENVDQVFIRRSQ